jgi:hypothetical protein
VTTGLVRHCQHSFPSPERGWAGRTVGSMGGFTAIPEHKLPFEQRVPVVFCSARRASRSGISFLLIASAALHTRTAMQQAGYRRRPPPGVVAPPRSPRSPIVILSRSSSAENVPARATAGKPTPHGALHTDRGARHTRTAMQQAGYRRRPPPGTSDSGSSSELDTCPRLHLKPFAVCNELVDQVPGNRLRHVATPARCLHLLQTPDLADGSNGCTRSVAECLGVGGGG